MAEPARKIFGTDGVRGLANSYPMTVEVAVQLGRAVAHLINHGDHRHRVIIGKDTRLSGYMLENALASGIMSMGVDVALVGPMPTPAIAHLVTSMRCDAGAVISASHNPYEDNGIKFFWRDGYKLHDDTEASIEALMASSSLDALRPTATRIGGAVRLEDARGRYIEALKGTFPQEFTLEGLVLVVDCAHGAGYRVAPDVLTELGAKVITYGVDPDGMNINDNCGALFPKGLQRAVREHKADLGIALDGDADRLVVVDERGSIVDGDALIALCAEELIARGALTKRTIVTTVMSNMGLEHALARHKVRVLRTKVGDRYVVEAMRGGGFVFGGEQSGHLIFLDHATTGDGTLAALQVLSALCRTGRRMSELTKVFEALPQVLESIAVAEQRPIDTLPEVQRAIAAAEKALGKSGRVFVRFSGTEPKVRVLVEGPNMDKLRRHATSITGALKRSLGARR